MPRDASDHPTTPDDSRRAFVKRARYLAPVLLTLPAVPALAQVGSGAANPCPDPRFPLPFTLPDGTITCLS